MRSWVIKKLGGYTDVQDALGSVHTDKERNRLLADAMGNIYNTVSVYDILRKENGAWMFGNKVLTDAQYVILQEQARTLQKSLLFRILEIDLKYQCGKLMRKAQTVEELQRAKIVEYTFDILKTRLSEF